MKIRTSLLALIIITSCSHLFAQSDIKKIERKPLYIGEVITFQSKILGEARKLNIYLPNGYDKDSLKKYPVIYLLDGSINEDFIHISGLVQFGSFPWVNIIPQSIVVGIANVDRRRDFTFPTNNKKDKKAFPTTGKSKRFIQFIAHEVQPLIEMNYRTEGPKTIIGQSLGGLLTTEILFKRPELFDNYIIVSPSLWWDDGSLLNYLPETYSSKKSIYIAVGNEDAEMVNAAKELYEKLKSKKKSNTNLYFKFFEGLDHGNILHLAVYEALIAIFKEIKK